jgi:hypothetical protein
MISVRAALIAQFCLTVIATPSARAGDPRCNAPPYGGTEVAFHAFVKNFGNVVDIVQVLSEVCNEKYSGASRRPLYTFGFTDDQIDSKNTEDLAVDMILALHDTMNRGR